MTDNTFMGNDSWWIVVLFLFAFMGGGFGGYGYGNGGGVRDSYVLASDFSNLSRQIDQGVDRLAQQTNSIANGLCDGFYTQAQLVNGLQNTVNQNTFSLSNAITNAQINAMQNANALQGAVQTGFCTTNYNNQNNTRDIIDAGRCDTQQILCVLNQMKMDAKDQKIADQASVIASLQLAASQAAQNQYLISELKPATATTT